MIRIIGYDSDSVAHDLVNNKGRYKIPDHALRDYGIEVKQKVRKPSGKPKILKSKKELMLIAGCKCYICNNVLTKITFSWDHIVPKSKGGKKIKACCIYCNNQKGAMGVWEFIDYLKTLVTTPRIELKIKNLELFAIKNREL